MEFREPVFVELCVAVLRRAHTEKHAGLFLISVHRLYSEITTFLIMQMEAMRLLRIPKVKLSTHTHTYTAYFRYHFT